MEQENSSELWEALNYAIPRSPLSHPIEMHSSPGHLQGTRHRLVRFSAGSHRRWLQRHRIQGSGGGSHWIASAKTTVLLRQWKFTTRSREPGQSFHSAFSPEPCCLLCVYLIPQVLWHQIVSLSRTRYRAVSFDGQGCIPQWVESGEKFMCYLGAGILSWGQDFKVASPLVHYPASSSPKHCFSKAVWFSASHKLPASHSPT